MSSLGRPGSETAHKLNQSRVAVPANERVVPVLPALTSVLPDGGVRRGSVVTVAGSTSLALALLAGPSAEGSWCAAIGIPSLGLIAATELGVALDRFALVGPVPAKVWTTVVAALLEAIDVILAWSPPSVRPTDARRLAARAREHGSILVLATGGSACHARRPVTAWPDSPNLRLSAGRSRWVGLEQGHGRLMGRQVEVVVDGRRAAARQRRAWLWLPGPNGTASSADAPADLAGHQTAASGLVATGTR